MVESLQGTEVSRGTTEEEELIKQTKALLANLKSDVDNVDQAEEQAKQDDVRARMAALGSMIDKADQIRSNNNDAAQQQNP